MSAAARVRNAVRLNLRVQRRSGFVAILLGLAAAAALGVRLAVPEALWDRLVPSILLIEYGGVGLTLVAAQQFLERSEQSVAALVVSPLRSGEHVAALLLAPALVGTVAGVGLFAGVLGVDLRIAWLLPPLGLTSLLLGSVGLWASSCFEDFTRFLVGGVPIVVAMQLPLLPLFGLTPRFTWPWHPIDAAVFAFADLVRDETAWASWLGRVALLSAFAAAGAWRAHRVYRARVLQRVGEGA